GYYAGADGFVWSKRCKGAPRRLYGCNGRGQYKQVSLMREGKCSTKAVAPLILAAFSGPRPTGRECCHNDGDRHNNKPGNLRWGTRIENTQDRYDHGTILRGVDQPLAKLTPTIVRAIRHNHKVGAMTMAQLARKYGVN